MTLLYQLSHRHTGRQEDRKTGTEERSGTQEYRNRGTQEQRNAQEYRNRGTQRNTETRPTLVPVPNSICVSGNKQTVLNK